MHIKTDLLTYISTSIQVCCFVILTYCGNTTSLRLIKNFANFSFQIFVKFITNIPTNSVPKTVDKLRYFTKLYDIWIFTLERAETLDFPIVSGILRSKFAVEITFPSALRTLSEPLVFTEFLLSIFYLYPIFRLGTASREAFFIPFDFYFFGYAFFVIWVFFQLSHNALPNFLTSSSNFSCVTWV